jgi:hypothetical protein
LEHTKQWLHGCETAKSVECQNVGLAATHYLKLNELAHKNSEAGWLLAQEHYNRKLVDQLADKLDLRFQEGTQDIEARIPAESPKSRSHHTQKVERRRTEFQSITS